jgi:hypothetical protein
MIVRCERLQKIINIKKSGTKGIFPLPSERHCPAGINGLQAVFLEKKLYLDLFFDLKWFRNPVENQEENEILRP